MNQNEKKFFEDGFKFNVMIRVRPFLCREENRQVPVSALQISADNTRIDLFEMLFHPGHPLPFSTAHPIQNNFPANFRVESNPGFFSQHTFTFDHVFGPESNQAEVYGLSALKAVDWLLAGYNSTILTYGQTGTGKTYTMEGPAPGNWALPDAHPGLIQLALSDLFDRIQTSSKGSAKCIVRVSYLQIYKEIVNDLLQPEKTNLHIREDKRRGIYIEGLSEYIIASPQEGFKLLAKGSEMRATACTKINDFSSRSHSVFCVTVEQLSQATSSSGEEIRSCRISKLNLVDLAGSERIKISGAVGQRLEEGKKINQSLSALSKVISSLLQLNSASQLKPLQPSPSSPVLVHIPYRNSKLTRLLEDSLGGNCVTTLIGTVSPSSDAFDETLSTLKFANRAKKIKNKPKVNEQLDSKNLILKYRDELEQLKGELQRVNEDIKTSTSYFRLQEEKRLVEADKQKIALELEQKSKAFLKEREEKKRLLQKIQVIESNFNFSGKETIFADFLEDCAEMENSFSVRIEKKDNENKGEGKKGKLARYRDLLVRQNDMLLELSSRLKARDQTILQMQDELEAYDKIHAETADLMAHKNTRIELLESLLKNSGLEVPPPCFPSQREFDQFNQAFLALDKNSKGSRAARQNPILTDDLQAEIERIRQEYCQQITLLNEQSAKKQNELKEQLRVLEKNNRELLKMVSHDDGGLIKDQTVRENIKTLQSKIDCIIADLSAQREPEMLTNATQNLISLQQLVLSLQEKFPNSKFDKKIAENQLEAKIEDEKSETRGSLLRKLVQSKTDPEGTKMQENNDWFTNQPSNSEKQTISKPGFCPSKLLSMYSSGGTTKEKLISRIINKK